MRKSTTVKPVMWCKRSFKKIPVDAKLVFLFLMTGPDTNLSGLVTYPLPTLMDCTGLTEARARKAIKHLADKGSVLWDEWNDLFLLVKWFKYNPLTSPKHEIAVRNHLESFCGHEYAVMVDSTLSGEVPDRVSIWYREGIDTLPSPSYSDKGRKERTKNTEKKNIYIRQAREVLAHLIEVTGRNFTNTKDIEACLKREGCSVEDCKLVIDRNWAEKRGTEFEGFVDTVTPFRPSKFAGSLDRAKAGAPIMGHGAADDNEAAKQRALKMMEERDAASGR